MNKMKNMFLDFFFFLQVLFYWPLAMLLLKPLWWIDKKTGLGYFKYLDKMIKNIAGK